MSNIRWLLAALVAVALVPTTNLPGAAQAAQTGTVQGTVVDAQTARPLPSVQVFIEGTQLGTLTNQQGRFQILNVPAGQRNVRGQLIGYATETVTVSVVAGEAASVNLSLQPTAIALQEVVVTGVAGATTRAKIPFTVDQLRPQDMPVPAVSAGNMIQGKIAGATVVQGSGRPGSPPSILLRGPTSIDATGRNQEPLYIVDGVILAASMVDLDALDIANVEVVKGAAAASLYGSRAAAGVINITTRRGTGVPQDQIRYTARTEFGSSSLTGRFDLAQRHAFALTEDGTQFIQANGVPCNWLQCGNVRLAGQRAAPGQAANNWNSFMTNPWPGQTNDHVADFFRDGAFMQHYVSAEGRSGATNFHVSFSNLDEEGVMPGQEGFRRNNFRVNLDQSVLQDLQLSASAFYSRSNSNEFPESQGNPMFTLTRMPAGVDLRSCLPGTTDGQGNAVTRCDTPELLNRMILRPDPFNENANPLYEMLARNYEIDRGRFLGSANLRWSPLQWMDLDANASYDRLDYVENDLYPLGFRTIRATPSLNRGYIYRYNELTEALNGAVTATVRGQFGDLQTRTQLRYLAERQDLVWNWTDGSQFAVGEVPQFGNLDRTTLNAGSSFQPVRSDGYFVITNFDFRDRYILDALIRNDGSSLFGPENRRHWYYRLGGRWRVGEEEWFNLPGVGEFGLRYSYGTAGGRPAFVAQYETFTVTGGRVNPVTLGNVNLAPEFSREHEAGVDIALLDRFVLGLTYANTTTEDQILRVPLPAYMGFGEQWQNAGTLASNTWEASLDARIMQTRDLTWSARLLYDRTRQEITALNVPPYTYGVFGQNLGNVFYARPGEPLGTFYGAQFATSCEQLPQGVSCDGFQVNNDGYLVWVGQGNTLESGMWGTRAPADAAIRGVAPFWGTPFQGECVDRVTGERTTFCPLGRTMPDYNVSLSSTVNWRGLSVYGLLDAVQGFMVYNQPLQWSTFQSYAGIMDQTGLPPEQQKPMGYYIDGLYNGGGGLRPSSEFVEDGSFVKLREVALRYRFGEETLGALPGIRAFSGATFSLVGRNLLTWSNYRGYDPEVGRTQGAAGVANPGSAALARVDGYNYPQFRTWTFGVELNF